MLSRDEATATLKNIRDTQGRSTTAYGYASAAPFLILWGAIWFAGYGATDLFPHYSGWAWIALVALGFVASTVMGMRRAPATDRTQGSLRIVATWLVVLAYMCAVLAIMKPQTGEQIGAFIPLIIAFVYAILGIWAGMRFLIAGAAIATLTLGGFFLLTSHFALWMAFVGGGTLIATGLWLRKA